MNVELYISKQALERLNKDGFIKQNRKYYNNEILMIKNSEGTRPAEKIGRFNISPRGHKNIRVAWHFEYDSKTETLRIFIDDLLYHIREGLYVDKWNIKVREGSINLGGYSGYSQWVPF